MLLNVHISDRWHSAEAPEEQSRLLSEVFEILRAKGSGGPDWRPGEVALFSFSEQRPYGDSDLPDNCLKVSVNASSGYGGLVWFSAGRQPRISDNPEPPAFDPEVVSDPGYPLFHDPASTLPIAHVRLAVEEFVRTGTGECPTSVSWTSGGMSGQRDDREPMIDTVDEPAIDWDSLR